MSVPNNILLLIKHLVIMRMNDYNVYGNIFYVGVVKIGRHGWIGGE